MKKDPRDKVFIVTDACMWERQRLAGTRAPHSIEVVDMETGQVRYIKSGSKIAFVGGEITEEHTQEEYNNSKNEPNKTKGRA